MNDGRKVQKTLPDLYRISSFAKNNYQLDRGAKAKCKNILHLSFKKSGCWLSNYLYDCNLYIQVLKLMCFSLVNECASKSRKSSRFGTMWQQLCLQGKFLEYFYSLFIAM